MTKCTALIVRAGAAALAAATRLVANCHTVTLLEARDRVGGRIYTIRGAWPVAIEAGPEFVHGDDPEFKALLNAAGVQMRDLAEQHWKIFGGKPALLDFGSAWGTFSTACGKALRKTNRLPSLDEVSPLAIAGRGQGRG